MIRCSAITDAVGLYGVRTTLCGSTSSSSVVVSGPAVVVSACSPILPASSSESPFKVSIGKLGLTGSAKAGDTPTNDPAEQKAC